MKKIITYAILFFLGLSFFSCKKNSTSTCKEELKTKIKCSATLADDGSKAVFDGLQDATWKRLWTGKDIVVLMVSLNESYEMSDAQVSVSPLETEDGNSASMEPSFNFATGVNDYNMFYALYPESQYVSESFNPSKQTIWIDVPSTQIMPDGVDTVDEKAMILTYKPTTVTDIYTIYTIYTLDQLIGESPVKVEMDFESEEDLTKYFNVTFKGLPADIEVVSVDVKFGEYYGTDEYVQTHDKMRKVAGRYEVVLAEPEEEDPLWDWIRWTPVGELSDTIHIIPNKNSGVWFGIHCMVRTDYRDITFTVNAKNGGCFVRTITTGEDNYLVPGAVASMTVNFAKN